MVCDEGIDLRHASVDGRGDGVHDNPGVGAASRERVRSRPPRRVPARRGSGGRGRSRLGGVSRARSGVRGREERLLAVLTGTDRHLPRELGEGSGGCPETRTAPLAPAGCGHEGPGRGRVRAALPHSVRLRSKRGGSGHGVSVHVLRGEPVRGAVGEGRAAGRRHGMAQIAFSPCESPRPRLP